MVTGRRLHGGALLDHLHARAHGNVHRGIIGAATALSRRRSACAKRHQEGPGLLDHLATRVHVSGCGMGAFVAAIFHVMTHAFFKAQLFLGSGR
jgi:hypothetical protein